MNYNPELMALAEWRLAELRKQHEKQAFIPPGGGGDPSGGGGPPPGMDPSMAGGPGGPPPGMDPAAMGGAPPMPPGGGGMDPMMIQQMVTQAVQQAMGAQGGAGAAGGPVGAAGAGKPVKASLETVAMDIYQVKTLLVSMFNQQGWPLPSNILDGPNRDPNTGMPMAPGTPGSTSDPAQMQAAQQQAGAGGAQGGAIPSIPPMEAAGPGVGDPAAGGGAMKAGEDETLHVGSGHRVNFTLDTINRAAALAAICRRLK